MPVKIEIIELNHQQWYLYLNGRFRYCCGEDTNEKTNVTAEHFIDEVHSSGLKYSIGEPDQFLPNVTVPKDEDKPTYDDIGLLL